MSILKIAKMGNPILRKKAEKITDFSDPQISIIIEDMIQTMVDANGQGLAANQVHVLKRIVVYIPPPEEDTENEDNASELDADESEISVLINPEIEYLTEEIKEDWEGCLSVPGMRGIVPRKNKIKLSYQRINGTKIEETISGYHARVVQHECDHLDGILYPMRMRNLGSLIFESELPKLIKSAQKNNEK